MVDGKRIYELMSGLIAAGSEPELEKTVKNEFQKGSKYTNWREEVYQARLRLGERLKEDDEDPDILAIVESYESITKKRCVSSFESSLKGLILDETPQYQEEYRIINNAKASLMERLQANSSDLDIITMISGYETMLSYMEKKMIYYGHHYRQVN